MLVATPSGITLAPEGGAHQSIHTPLIGIGQPGLTVLEPAFVDELAVLMRWSFEHMQQPKGASIYLRLSTRACHSRSERCRPSSRRTSYRAAIGMQSPGRMPTWPSSPWARSRLKRSPRTRTSYATSPAPAFWYSPRPTACTPIGLPRNASAAAQRESSIDQPSPIESLLAPLSRDARLVTVLDGHPLALSWLGSVRGHRVVPLGIEGFGQSGDIPDLYRTYRLDAAAIVDAVARAIS